MANGMLNNPMLNVGLGILSQSGPSRLPQGFSGIGRGAMLGMGQASQLANRAAQTNLLQQQTKGIQLGEEQWEESKADIAEYLESTGMSTPEIEAILTLPKEASMQVLKGILGKPAAGQKPTSLMQNLAAAGLQPGSPEYQQRMAAALPGAEGTGKPKLPDISSLRKEYTAVSKDWLATRSAYEKVEASRDTPAGDISLIFAYMKMIDPASTVREGEAATLEQARGAAELVPLYNRIVTGERLTAAQRRDFKAQSQALLADPLRHQIAREEQYKGIAGSAGIDASNVVRDLIGKEYRGMLGSGQGKPEYIFDPMSGTLRPNP